MPNALFQRWVLRPGELINSPSDARRTMMPSAVSPPQPVPAHEDTTGFPHHITTLDQVLGHQLCPGVYVFPDLCALPTSSKGPCLYCVSHPIIPGDIEVSRSPHPHLRARTLQRRCGLLSYRKASVRDAFGKPAGTLPSSPSQLKVFSLLPRAAFSS